MTKKQLGHALLDLIRQYEDGLTTDAELRHQSLSVINQYYTIQKRGAVIDNAMSLKKKSPL